MPAIRRGWTSVDVRALTNESRAWPRYELIDGELLVTPAPATSHQFAVVELVRLLDAYLTTHPVGAVIASPADLELRPGTITQPDVFVVPSDTRMAGERLAWTDVTTLLLAVEVLSPSSGRTDRVVKRDFYLDARVAEYWIVDLDARIVERWTPKQRSPEVLRDRLDWNVASPALGIDVTAFFERIETKMRMFNR